MILALSASMAWTVSCRKSEKVDTDPSLRLDFSTDTIFFDTVFTTIGSVTQRLMVYNNNDHKLVISSIALAGGGNSCFRINIDGTPSLSISNVGIDGHDSLFIFIRVTVDPTGQGTPFIIADSIVFTVNGNLQDVKLVAWGQNAIFHKQEELAGNAVWDSLKPHVIYGYLRVDTSSTLTILPGSKIYFHMGSYLALSHLSSLKILGNLAHPVRFQGDRLDPYYRDLPGQWDGILLESGSRDHEINYAVVKNGTRGIGIDSATVAGTPMLKIDNTIIQNMTYDGIFAYASSILSTNCVIGNCGGSALDLTFGGSYDFRQLTIGNYWGSSVRVSPSLYLSNFTYDNLGNRRMNALSNAYFGNCIIAGNQDEEILPDKDDAAQFQFAFDHCLLTTQINTGQDPQHYISCLVNEDPLFLDVQDFDYRIDSLSPVIDKGIQVGVLYDILGVERGSTPDLGAYQWVPSR
jgi:hypothetical protein